VSAGQAIPAALGSRSRDPVRALQHALYRAAKADPGRRFHALHDQILCRDVMWRAWVGVRRNDGAGSIDRITPDAIEEYGVTRILDALVTDLREDRWHPMPFRRVFIPKSGSAERRPLSIRGA
jgi:retron-type reverse transcriptase